ncbi:MAG TPA: tRNA (adenosine(37)-N6)-dimethylallyltransferase MiaA [Acidimicrobiia bacterium]|nr:tRNA (adenosine(37)-N6)-dimethylallyltransferase MiaA [Acidimicrobiia bacterium]
MPTSPRTSSPRRGGGFVSRSRWCELTRHLAIVGPTASGKSAVALEVAATLGDVEIVSLDSMQVYRGMDIGTAKPSRADRASVPHHLVDVADPSDEWSVRETQHAARAAIDDIEARGRRALLVGGTGLYVRAVVDRLSVPPRDMDVRAALDHETATDTGLALAYARLVAADPVAASRIEPGNARRIVRALEVMETTGRPFSSFGSGLAEYGPPAFDIGLVGVWLPRAELGRRITDRFAAMRADGLESEVRALTAAGTLSRTAAQAIGYKELLAHFDGEIPTLAEAFELAVSRTRRFARRQRVWFRRDPRIRWVGTARNPQDVVGVVLALWETRVATVAAESS